jgi:hypothetical protein
MSPPLIGTGQHSMLIDLQSARLLYITLVARSTDLGSLYLLPRTKSCLLDPGKSHR